MSETEKKKSQRWVLPTIGFIIALSLGVSFGPDLVQHLREKRITESGVQAPARIIDLVDTGNRYNSNPEVRLILEVQPEDGEPFRSTATQVLTAVALQKYTPGTMVTVMYDPGKPEQAVVFGVQTAAGR